MIYLTSDYTKGKSMESIKFIEALKSGDLDKIKKIRKSDLHNHCGLGMRFSEFKSWCGVELTPPPKVIDGISGLDKYLSEVTMEHVLSREGVEYSLKSTIEAAIEDGVTILETSIDCCNIQYYDNASQFFSFIEKCRNEYSSQIDFRPEIGVFKGLPKRLWETYVKQCIESGVFNSIDLYGDENILQLDIYQQYFKSCKDKGIKTKIHIGEFCGPQEIKRIILELEPDEIQHGIQSYQSEEVMILIKEKDIRLHICPTSNIVLGAVKTIKSHPIRKLFDAGVKVTINTDDLLLFDSSISEEFLKLFEEKIFTAEELDLIRLYGLEA